MKVLVVFLAFKKEEADAETSKVEVGLNSLASRAKLIQRIA